MADENIILPQSQTPTETPKSPSALLSWEASEYVHHQKPSMWYLGFLLVGFVVTGLLYLIIRDIFAVVVVVLMFVALFVYAVRRPETLHYEISDDGITIGNKHYSFGKFRSFGVIAGEGVPSISFEPLQRFAPPISVYCSPEDANKVVGILAKYLPQTDKQPDIIDRLTHYLRF